MVLMPRDRQILVAVHQHGFLTTELVELAFFPPQDEYREWSSSKAYERIRKLWLWGYLERIELPLARTLGGRRPFLYALGNQGVAIVEAHMGTARLPVQPRRIDRLDHVFVDHDLKAAALWANLYSELGERNGRRFGWMGERELRAKRMRVRSSSTGYWTPFLPDAYFEVTNGDGLTRSVVVEIDMGTLTLRRFARKMQAFEDALEDGVFRHHFNRHEFEVLILTQSRRRLDWLRKAASRAVEGSRHASYRLATFDALEPSGFPKAIFQDLYGDEHEGILDDNWVNEAVVGTHYVDDPICVHSMGLERDHRPRSGAARTLSWRVPGTRYTQVAGPRGNVPGRSRETCARPCCQLGLRAHVYAGVERRAAPVR